VLAGPALVDQRQYLPATEEQEQFLPRPMQHIGYLHPALVSWQ
jgi:hypothetical protein